jgi:Rad3-related DNA helicase
MVITPNDVLEHGYKNVVREVRPTQVALANAIDDAFISNANYTVMIEGGTGIGKSFSYLLPAILSTTNNVVVATAKKTLQDQLVKKDLPYLKEKLGIDFDFVLLKGKGNYACQMILHREAPPEHLSTLLKMKEENTYIQRDDWPGEEPIWWGRISAENCPFPKNCPKRKECRPEMKDARIIVANHHYLALHLIHGIPLGESNILIVDEAHQLLKAVRSMLNMGISEKHFSRILYDITSPGPLSYLLDAYGRFPGEVALKKTFQECTATIGNYCTFLSKRFPQGVRANTFDNPVFKDALQSVESKMSELLVAIERVLVGADVDIHENRDNIFGVELDEALAGVSRLRKCQKRTAQIINGIQQILPEKKKTENAWVISADEAEIQARPIDIVPFISTNLTVKRTKVFVSATLAVGGDFSYTRKAFGLDKDVVKNADGKDEKVVYKEYIFNSPFDFQRQALLYAPFHTNIPAQPHEDTRDAWIQNMSDEILRLCTLSNGRGFILFSSTADMLAIHESVKPFLEALSMTTFVQGTAGNGALLQDYIKEDKGVLFGLESFWEGVDIPGDKLQLVVIPKLPFPNPSDPVVKAESELAENSFTEIFIPRMIFTLKQGVGRLIRTQQDRGIVAILDPRVWTGTKKEGWHRSQIRAIEERYKSTARLYPKGYGQIVLKAVGFPVIIPHFETLEKYASKYLNTSV